RPGAAPVLPLLPAPDEGTGAAGGVDRDLRRTWGGPGMSSLRGASVTLRPASEADVPALAAIRATPEVHLRWSGGPDFVADVRADLADPDTVVYAIEYDRRLVGAIEYHVETDPMYRHAGIDIFLDPSVHGRGLGTD